MIRRILEAIADRDVNRELWRLVSSALASVMERGWDWDSYGRDAEGRPYEKWRMVPRDRSFGYAGGLQDFLSSSVDDVVAAGSYNLELVQDGDAVVATMRDGDRELWVMKMSGIDDVIDFQQKMKELGA